MRRELHALVLALVGGTLLKLAIDGDYQRYVKVGLRPYLVAAAVVVLAVAALSLRPARRGGPVDHHGHGHGRFDVAWLLVLPMLALLLLAPPALGSFSAARSGTALGAAGSQLGPLPGGDPVKLSILDYDSRAVFDHGRSLAGRHITLSGFVLPGDGGTWYLVRMVITCCAADAQPIKVGLAGTLPGGLKPNDWIAVTGTYLAGRTDRDPVNGEPIPYLTVATSTPVPAPALQYES